MNEATPMTLSAVFIADESQNRKGFTGARCELPNGQVVETQNRRTPLYDLARKLEELGFGDWKLQAYTPTGTPSLKQSDKGGVRLRKYKPFSVGGRVTQRDLGSEGTQPPEKAETRLSESLPDEEAA